MNMNDDEALGLINRLLERLHQADLTNFGSHLQIVYVASGAQHVETQINYGASPRPLPCGREKVTMEKKEDIIKNDAPLSALFRKNSHEKLQKVMETWRPFLNGETEDVMKLNEFRFDLSRIQPSTVYLDLAQLINQGGLQCSMSVLAAYMFSHSNLSQSETTLYSQLRKYKCICE
jgi:hypothetical protein